MYDPFSTANPVIRGVDAEELAASGASFEEPIHNYAAYGLISSLTSAGVGLYNTAVSLGNTFGADLTYAKESDVIATAAGNDAAAFYSRHKAGADAAGFLISSLGVGLAAVKGLRLAQGAGYMTLGTELATGARNADIVMGSRQLLAAKEAALANPMSFSINNSATWNAIGQGFKQQMAEAFVFDAAVTATNNQNALVNPGHDSYLEAAANMASDTWKFTLLGGALGGTIQGLQIRSALKQAYNAKTAEYSHLTTLMKDLPEYANSGDKVALGLSVLGDLRHNEKFQMDALDAFGVARKQKAEDQVMSYIQDSFIDINKAGKEGLQALDRILTKVKAEPMTTEQLYEEFAGIRSLNYIGEKDFASMHTYWNASIAPTVVTIGKDVEQLTQLMVSGLKVGAPEHMIPIIDGLESNFRATLLGEINSKGFMVGEGNNFRSAVEDLLAGVGSWAKYPDMPALASGQGLVVGHAVVNESASSASWLKQINDNFSRVEDALRKRGLIRGTDKIFSSLTHEEDLIGTMVHELTHWKTNSTAALNSVRNAMTKDTKLGKELEMFGRQLYPGSWAQFDYEVEILMLSGMSKKEARAAVYSNPAVSSAGGGGYALTPQELISQASQYLLHPAYAEKAAKFAPNLVKFFNRNGGIYKPYNEVRNFKNVRTGKEYTGGILPLPQDLGKVTQVGDTVRVANTNIGFKYSRDFFNPKLVEQMYRIEYAFANIEEYPYMKAASMFAAAAQKKFADFIQKGSNSIVVHQHDLPMLEKLHFELQNPANVQLMKDKGITLQLDVGDTVPKLQAITTADLKDTLLKGKQEMSFAMRNMAANNEWFIANALNMDVERALNIVEAGKDMEAGYLLMGERNYDQAEHIMVLRAKSPTKEIDVSTRSAVAVQQRAAIRREETARAASQVLGERLSLLPSKDSVTRAIPHLNETATRSGPVTQVRGEIGTRNLRDLFQYAGRIKKLIVGEKAQNIEETWSKHYANFNAPENVKLRMELSLATNKLYEGWHNSFKLEYDGLAEAQHYLIRLDDYHAGRANFESMLEGAASGDIVARQQLTAFYAKFPAVQYADAEQQALQYVVSKGVNDGTMKLSKEVFDMFESAVKPFQSEAAANHDLIARARGSHSTYRTDVLYPPPRDLRKYPHVAFVIPKTGMADADATRYMLFGKTAEELQVKRLAAEQKYGNDYRIVTQEQITDFKQLMQEYDKNKVFDEWFFDPTLTRRGRTAEAIPNLNIEASEVLDRFRNYQHRVVESQVRSGIELYYDDAFHALKAADREYGREARASVVGRTAKSTIFEDTMNLALDKAGKQGEVMEQYKKISGIVGEKGGQVIDAVVNRLGKTPSGKLTQESFDKMNKELEEAGFNPPFQDMMRAIVASPDVTNSRSMELAIRTMNNLVGTFQLRLDVANSILQTISTPILMLPVVREALENSAQVRQALTVVNPALKMKEPTPMKLLFKAVQKFWTPEGKALMEEARARGILSDYLKEYHEAQDFSTLTGKHSMKVVNDAIDKLGAFGGKWSLHRFSEDFSRFLVVSAIDDVCTLRGIAGNERWAVIGNSVDAVHGIYRANQRVQLFNGVIGQAIGMYQTYMFNWAQNALKWVADGNKRQALTMGMMQASTFGLRSFPGFETFNQMVADTNTGKVDLYGVTNADDPKSWGAWTMYGLGSHAFIFPTDFASRGDMVVRNATVLPTDFKEIPTVSILGNVIKNLVETGKMVANGDTSVGNALLFGLAHNGLSRPLQGLGTIALGQVTSSNGTPLFVNSNHADYDAANELSLGSMASRLIGTRPLEEAIMLDNFYRQKTYLSNMRDEILDVGKEIKLAVANGKDVSREDWQKFAVRYEEAGGKIENFNSYTTQLLTAAKRSDVEVFREEMQQDGPMSRMYRRMAIEREAVNPDSVQQE